MVRLRNVLLFVLLAAVASSTALAAEDNWRISLRADNGSGGGSGIDMQAGALPLAIDGPRPGAWEREDLEAYYLTDFPQVVRWISTVIAEDTRTWTRDIRSPATPASYPGGTKVWDLRIAGMPNATPDPIRLFLRTLSSGSLQPAAVGGVEVGYRLVMVDNRGVPGAPANLRVWDLPIPTAHASEPYWYLPQADWLPMLRVSSPTHEAMIAEGYVMRFEQYVLTGEYPVPEPAAMPALGMGLAGIAASALRKRRA
ncbi:MAG: PEP-CTERM sorting domain-containing protein [Armatimonadetes bacterium]|nr:PEP-CTERM sorting domain-containing protein [Armatimonadota bacterium]